MSHWAVHSRSVRGTQNLARLLAAKVQGGDVIALHGDLGAGKTTFVRGLAQGLGVRALRDVTSPTYAIMNLYPCDPEKTNAANAITEIAHIDFYRLDDVETLYALGVGDRIGAPDTLTVIEWPSLFLELLPKNSVHIYLAPYQGGRQIEVMGLARPKRTRLHPAPLRLSPRQDSV